MDERGRAVNIFDSEAKERITQLRHESFVIHSRNSWLTLVSRQNCKHPPNGIAIDNDLTEGG
jgi:hypothetical protein